MKKETDTEFAEQLGKMIKGKHSLLLKKGELSDTQNMQPGYQWKQRRGMTALTASAVASGLRWKSFVQFRDLEGTTDVLLAHTYDGSGGEDLYQGSALPPNSITWTKKYDLTASCEKCQFANVGGALLIANNKDFLIWRGTSHKPTGVWFYDATNTAYINYFDEMTDGDTSTTMDVSSMATGDEIVVLAEMPLDTITPTFSAYNSTDSNLLPYYWNGSWSALETATHADGSENSWDCSSLTGWTDQDGGTGASTQETFQGRSCFKLTDGAGSGGSDYARRLADHGSTPSGVLYYSFRIYFSPVDTGAFMILRGYSATQGWTFYYRNGTSYVYKSGGGQSVLGTNEIIDEWHILTIAVDWSASPITMDIYLNDTKHEENIQCDHLSGSYTDGQFFIDLHEGSSNGSLLYFDDIWIGESLVTSAEFTDGTYTGDATMAQAGSWSWTGPSDEIPTNVEGVPGYAYKFKVTTALDSSTTITGVTVHSPMASVKNVWDGGYINPTGCYVYDGSDYTDAMAYVNNTVQAQYADLSGATTSYDLYVGFPVRVNEIEFYPATAGKNAANAQVDYVGYYNTAGAATSLTFTDTTLDDAADSSFAQKGSIYWADPGRYNEKMTKIGGDRVPMYWYKIEWDATLTDPTYIYYIRGIPAQDDPDASYGVFAFKRRAWQIAPINYENTLRYSAANLPNVWNGNDSGYIYFGERPLRAAIGFYNSAVVFADSEIWMLRGSTPVNFNRMRLSSRIGISSPQSLLSIESGVVVGDSIKNVLVWFFYDGIWMFDGVRMWKVSSPDIDSFFDPDHDDYINPAKLSETTGVYDFETQCAMWNVYSGSSATTPTKTLVMHFPTLHYGIYDYATEIDGMLSVINNKYYTIAGGNSDGRVYQLNSGTTDLVTGTATAVDAWIITRDEFLGYSDGLQERLLSVWVEAQPSGGQLELDIYPDGSKTPQNVAKQSIQERGKIYTILQRTLKLMPGQKSAKYRLRNRSKNARMNILGKSVTIDKDRANE